MAERFFITNKLPNRVLLKNIPNPNEATTSSGKWIDGTATGSATDDRFGFYTIQGIGNMSWQITDEGLTIAATTATGRGRAPSAPFENTTTVANINKYGIRVMPSTSYTFSYKAKGVNVLANSTRASVQLYNPAGAFVTSFSASYIPAGDSDWTDYSVTFTTGVSSCWLVVYPGVFTAGNIMSATFKDFKLDTTVPTTRTTATSRSTATNRVAVRDMGTALRFDGVDDYVNVGKVLPQRFTYVSESGDLNHHQGIAVTDDVIVLFDTDKITKTDHSYNVLSQVTGVNAALGLGTNHLGDGCILGDYIYVAVENWVSCGAFSNQYIAKYNLSDLSFVAAYDVSAKAREVSGVCTDGTYLYVSDYCSSGFITKYDLVGNWVSDITLSTVIGGINGIDIANNKFYLSTTDILAEYTNTGTFLTRYFVTTNEGISYYQGNMYCLYDGGATEKVTIYSYNPTVSGTIQWRGTLNGLYNWNSLFTDDYYANSWELFVYSSGLLRFALHTSEGLNGSYLTKDRAYDITVTYVENDTIVIYVNGLSVASRSITRWEGSRNLRIGGGGAGNTYAKCLCDEFRIFNRALTADEVKNLYLHGAVPQDGLVAEYLFDEGAGTTALDTSGNGNHGTITGATYTTDTPLRPRTSV